MQNWKRIKKHFPWSNNKNKYQKTERLDPRLAQIIIKHLFIIQWCYCNVWKATTRYLLVTTSLVCIAQYHFICKIYVCMGIITWVCSDIVQVQCLLGTIKTFCHALLWKINNSQHEIFVLTAKKLSRLTETCSNSFRWN